MGRLDMLAERTLDVRWALRPARATAPLAAAGSVKARPLLPPSGQRPGLRLSVRQCLGWPRMLVTR